jgi:glycerol-3-phosphate acyltransferase PlsX
MYSRMQRLRDQARQRRASRREVTVALDAMGTDHGPEELLNGAYAAVQEFGNITVACTGPEDKLRAICSRHHWTHDRLTFTNATQAVSMDEAAKDSLKKKDSSVAVAARLVREGVAAGMVSAGNTGAAMATAMFQWRTLPGISRPAIATMIPHPKNPCILLDVGANVDCKPRHLLHFAIMGSVYAHYVYRRRSPRIGLLSIGEEEGKGNELVFETQKLLKTSSLNYGGNAEGRDLFMGKFDVIVCDGFVGNVVLKFGEALAEFILSNLKQELSKNIVSQLGALAMMPAFRSFKRSVDYAEYGGAPLLGLQGNCVITHGSSKSKAIKNAIRVASELAGAKVNEHILELIARNNEMETAIGGNIK